MKILHLETSSRNCSVAVSDGDTMLCLCEEVAENYRQSESLHLFVEYALEGAGLTLRDIEAISLGIGPGSYTGLRIGAAAAKGFCYGLDVPLIATNSLWTITEPFIGKEYDLIIPMIDARRMEVYTAVYDGATGKEISATKALILDNTSFTELASDKKILFVGDGVAKAAEILTLENATYKADHYPSAQYLIKTAAKKFSQQEFESVAYFEPFYLKEFQGVKSKKSEG